MFVTQWYPPDVHTSRLAIIVLLLTGRFPGLICLHLSPARGCGLSAIGCKLMIMGRSCTPQGTLPTCHWTPAWPDAHRRKFLEG